MVSAMAICSSERVPSSSAKASFLRAQAGHGQALVRKRVKLNVYMSGGTKVAWVTHCLHFNMLMLCACTSLVFVWRYLSNATCMIRPRLFYACFVASRITILCYVSYSPLLKKTCVRQVMLDKSFPLNLCSCFVRVRESCIRAWL